MLRPPAAAAGPLTAAKSWCRSLTALRFVSGCNRLAGDHDLTFLQTTFGYFRGSTVAKSDGDATWLWFAVLAHHPNSPRLTRQNRGACGSELSLATLLGSACLRISGLRSATIGTLLPASLARTASLT